jgi:glycerate kinase
MENLKHLSNTELIMKPISDGGDGFLEACKFHFGGEIRKYQISNAYDEYIFECPILYVPDEKTVFLESAEILGFKVVPEKHRKPIILSSKGIGELLHKIFDDSKSGRISVDKIYLGVGGTATIDMGLGMMNKLGLKLYDAKGDELVVLPKNFNKTSDIEWNIIDLPFEIFPIADVTNQLIGKRGGVRVYGKQKGASQKELVEIESGFNNIINLLKNKKLLRSVEFLSGAGGGIPAALQIFFNSYCKSSYEFILNDLKLTDKDQTYDYLITGEGAFDKQTLYGKGAGLLTIYYSSKVKNVFLVCGTIENEIKDNLPDNVINIELSSYFNNIEESIKDYDKGIKLACKEISDQL